MNLDTICDIITNKLNSVIAENSICNKIINYFSVTPMMGLGFGNPLIMIIFNIVKTDNIKDYDSHVLKTMHPDLLAIINNIGYRFKNVRYDFRKEYFYMIAEIDKA